ncbi:MAG: efflux RND transporter periplasmic adaptor subunit [Wenzhouxiangella sp.]
MNAAACRAGWASGVLGALCLLVGCEDRSPTQPSPAPVEVTFSLAERVEQAATVQVAGVVRPARRAALGTRQAGAVRAVLVEAGDRVQAGQRILEVDARDLEAVVSAAREQRAAATAAWQQAQRNRKRFERLYQDELVAKIRLEEAELAEERARGAKERAAAELAAAQVNLDYSVLRAPFDGVVSEIIAETGSFVAPGPPLVVFEDRDQLEVDAGIDQASAARLSPGRVLDLEVDGFDPAIGARVQAVLPALTGERGEPATGTRLRLSIDDPPPGLGPGMVVTVKVPAGERVRSLVAVPSDALIQRGQLEGVFVIEADAEGADRAHLRWVTRSTAEGDGPGVYILSGLAGGERVVVGEVVNELQDNQRVAGRRRTAD